MRGRQARPEPAILFNQKNWGNSPIVGDIPQSEILLRRRRHFSAGFSSN
jgi:hypothetical protein